MIWFHDSLYRNAAEVQKLNWSAGLHGRILTSRNCNFRSLVSLSISDSEQAFFFFIYHVVEPRLKFEKWWSTPTARFGTKLPSCSSAQPGWWRLRSVKCADCYPQGITPVVSCHLIIVAVPLTWTEWLTLPLIFMFLYFYLFHNLQFW